MIVTWDLLAPILVSVVLLALAALYNSTRRDDQ